MAYVKRFDGYCWIVVSDYALIFAEGDAVAVDESLFDDMDDLEIEDDDSWYERNNLG